MRIIKGVGDLPHSKINICEIYANRRKIEFKITTEYAWKLFNEQNGLCALTGAAIEVKTGTIDRIDSSKGYLEGNIQWVTTRVNESKMNLANDDFIQWCHVIARRYEGKEVIDPVVPAPIGHSSDVVGKKFGILTVADIATSPASTRDDAELSCVCDCGKMCVKSQNYVVMATMPHCGCRGRQKVWRNYGDFAGTQWCRICGCASRRNISVTVSPRTVAKLFQEGGGICAVSGVPIYLAKTNNFYKTTASLDRIDSDYGYQEGNVRWLHYTVNIMKNNQTDSRFIEQCRAVAAYCPDPGIGVDTLLSRPRLYRDTTDEE